MSALATELQRLLDYLGNVGQQPPTRRLKIVEVPHAAPIDQVGRIRVPRDAIREPADYEKRFDQLLNAGLPWLNMTCYGVEDGALIVGIEIPDVALKRSEQTSVNLSGPAAKVIGNGWKVDEVLLIE